MKQRQHPITIEKSPRDLQELRRRVVDMGLEIRQGTKHEKVMGLDGSVIATMSMGSKQGNWRAPINAWLQIQRYFRDHPDHAEILMKKWNEKYADRGADQPARHDITDEEYGYRHVEQARADVRRTRSADHLPPMGHPQFRGRRLFTRSTHRVCGRCYEELFLPGMGVDQEPVQGLTPGRCCRCGEGTVGWFVRAHQKEWGCDHSAEL